MNNSVDRILRQAHRAMAEKQNRMSEALVHADRQNNSAEVRRLIREGARIDPAHGHALRLFPVQSQRQSQKTDRISPQGASHATKAMKPPSC